MIVQGAAPAMAQTRPAPEARPVPLPRPIPERPVPLPHPVPGRPVIQPPRPNPGPGYGHNRGYAGRITCESRNNRMRRCNARTENRVVLLTRSGNCTQGRTWGFDRRSIWVSRNCRGTFAYGYGNNWGGGWNDRPDRDRGPSTGLVIGGVAVAAGLIALLASQNNNRSATPNTAGSAPAAPPAYPPGPPATLAADLSSLQADARPAMQTCLFEASRQIGATGGTRLRFDRLRSIEPGNGGWRFAADLTATYPDGDRALPIYCRATPSQVIQLDFTA